MAKKTLVVPDLHLRKGDDVEAVIKKINPAQVIFLGDYFDQFDDTPTQNADMAKWLKWSVTQPGRTHLIGNHDIHYAWDYPFLRCPGFSSEKFKAIGRHMKQLDWAKLELYTSVESFLFFHGGLQISHIPATQDLTQLEDWLDEQEEEFWRAMLRGEEHWTCLPGMDRGFSRSNMAFGGLIWADFSSLVPLPGWNQIVGHTPDVNARLVDSSDSALVCLDTVTRYDRLPKTFGLLEGGTKFYTIETKDILKYQKG